MVELKNVSKYYHGYRAVDFINCKFESNRIAIFGEEKSGKSSLLRLISGVDEVSKGEILINGSKADINKDVYFTFRDGGLLKNKTIKDNLIYPLKIRGINDCESIVEKLIDEFDLSRVENIKPSKITFEERARIILAKIKLRDTSVLLIDNPFENLDLQTRKQYFIWFLSLIKDYKGIVIYSTNLKEELNDFSEVVLLNYGFVKGYGSLSDIVNNPQNLFSYGFLDELIMYNGLLYKEGSNVVFKNNESKVIINESISSRLVPEFLPIESILAVRVKSLDKFNKNKENISLNDLNNFDDLWLFDWSENSLMK